MIPIKKPMEMLVSLFPFKTLKNLLLINSEYHHTSLFTHKVSQYVSYSGIWQLIMPVIRRGINDWDNGLRGACQGGCVEVAKFMLGNGNDNDDVIHPHWTNDCIDDFNNLNFSCLFPRMNVTQVNVGLCYACRGGFFETAKLMIKYGANNLNEGLYYACESNTDDIIKFLIKEGACDWNLGLEGACRGGNTKLVLFMESLGANDWSRGLFGASVGRYMNEVNLMINNGGDINNCLYGACYGGHMDLVKLSRGTSSPSTLLRINL